jgi:hypothetical protein
MTAQGRHRSRAFICAFGAVMKPRLQVIMVAHFNASQIVIMVAHSNALQVIIVAAHSHARLARL